MESKIRYKTNIISKLIAVPRDFNFFQAIRILKRYLLFSKQPKKLLFKNASSAAFPAADIIKISSFELLVSFMGLTGQNGILPEHYSEVLLERLNQKDNTLADFLNIFHDRILHLFYDIWQLDKYYIAFETTAHFRNDGEQKAVVYDQTLRFINAASGQPKLASDNQLLPEDLWLFYAGLLNFQSRPAASLKLILQDYFLLPISISNYAPEWVKIDEKDRTRLAKYPAAHSGLGIDAVVGKRIWHIQNRFNIQIGPINYKEFKRLLPNGDMLKALTALVRCFTGMEFDFSIVLVLQGSLVPKCTLNSKKSMRLGWNSWLKYNRNFTKYAIVNRRVIW
jgi:type VI secretion system protein ImpH